MSAVIDNSADFIPASYRELLLGCGNRKGKRVWLEKGNPEWVNVTTLDVDPAVSPDVLFDLNKLGAEKLPFDDNTFDEIHAYDVLEHIGTQGDWKAFFDQFYEFWRVLKPDGLMFACVPHWESSWAWADPGHTRVMPPEMLCFLDQKQYEAQVGKTPMTDYRFYWKGDFQTATVGEQIPEVLTFVLIARK